MYIGIDFGTSFSEVATMYLDQPLVLLNPGEYGIPSEFYYDQELGILIGQDALDAGQGTAAKNLVSEVKMAILQKRHYVLDGKTFEPEEIIRQIYRALVQKAVQVARRRTGDASIEGVVISVPVIFGTPERYLISEAAKNCLKPSGGALPILSIIKEPVAAALSYYKTDLADQQTVLVYDLGGGTCDIALVQADANLPEYYTVVDQDALALGGRDWDARLVQHISRVVGQKAGVRVEGVAAYEEKIRRTAIAVKHDLSNPDRSRAVARVEINGTVYSTPITREMFDEMTSDLLKKTMDCLETVYYNNRHRYDIEEIVCVGGSSNMLQVEEEIRRRFPFCHVRLYEPEHAVVNGTAIYANMRRGLVQDKSYYSYGVSMFKCHDSDEEIIHNFILKGSDLPAEKSHVCSPREDNQETVRFRVYESTREEEEYPLQANDKREVGAIRLKLPPRTPHTTDLTCHIRLGADGMLYVEAQEPSGGRVDATFQVNKM